MGRKQKMLRMNQFWVKTGKIIKFLGTNRKSYHRQKSQLSGTQASRGYAKAINFVVGNY